MLPGAVRGASTHFDLPPEKRKVGGSTPPLTTTPGAPGKPSHLWLWWEESECHDAVSVRAGQDPRKIPTSGPKRTRDGPPGGQEGQQPGRPPQRFPGLLAWRGCIRKSWLRRGGSGIRRTDPRAGESGVPFRPRYDTRLNNLPAMSTPVTAPFYPG